MPFNDKGEFIRSESPPAPRSTPSRASSGQHHVIPPGRARVTSSVDRPQQPRSQGHASGPDPWEVVGAVLAIVIGLAVLAGAIWLVVAFYQWFLIGLVLWLISSIRKLFS
ncbi:hypothetical protein VB716_08540 [Synechococcus sp. CCY9201]|uniref:hypothetical protein n=1 Tax=Synechococcus sp. CCY9201 TaxID=174697 RepID=UPI002B218812|nr:hypothetical protein [Synechococcus sp. CCY9201]MEA5474267.1 hypothetical protein [Synechococcus sp. CCY9201]